MDFYWAGPDQVYLVCKLINSKCQKKIHCWLSFDEATDPTPPHRQFVIKRMVTFLCCVAILDEDVLLVHADTFIVQLSNYPQISGNGH